MDSVFMLAFMVLFQTPMLLAVIPLAKKTNPEKAWKTWAWSGFALIPYLGLWSIWFLTAIALKVLIEKVNELSGVRA